MKVKCTTTKGYIFSKRNRREEGYDIRTSYSDITVGNVYNVYGIMLYEDSISYLIYTDYDMPIWYYAEFFEVVDHKTPSTWFYKFFGVSDEYYKSAIWGYHELVFSEEHYNGLCEQEPEDVYLFYQRKKEIDSIS